MRSLWDSGAQVSMVSREWQRRWLPNLAIRNIREILDKDLDLSAANGTAIPYDGWIEVSLEIDIDGTGARQLQVPMLVTPKQLDEPIIGYNIIHEVVINPNSYPRSSHPIERAFGDIPSQTLKAILNVINDNDAVLGAVKVGRENVVIPRGESVMVPCRVHTGMPRPTAAVFEPGDSPEVPEGLILHHIAVEVPMSASFRLQIPVYNSTTHDITLCKRALLGTLQQSSHPMCGKLDLSHGPEEPNKPSNPVHVHAMTATDHWTPPVDLSHLSADQQKIVGMMLREESASFAKDEDDLGRIDSLQMTINLTDTEPVQRTYMSIPKPLHQEVKNYLLDLINRGWIEKSKSPYSSPVVCVRKKDGSLRLCVDYRALNAKTIPDRHTTTTD